MEGNSAIKDPRIETGFIGFFDILGYRSFLEPGITEQTLAVVDFLNRLPNKIEEKLKKHFGLENSATAANPLFEQIIRQLARVNPLVVSDSVLLRYAYDEDHEAEKPWQATTFLLAANILQRVMFDEGLPLRGAIAFGEFVFVENVFAGKPIIDAHTLGQSLDLAATTIHATAEEEFNKLIGLDTRTDEFLQEGRDGKISWLVRFATPVKGAGTPQLLCLNLAWPDFSESLDRRDLREYVHEQFLAHNKQIGRNAISKLENTERFLHFLKSRKRVIFDRSP